MKKNFASAGLAMKALGALCAGLALGVVAKVTDQYVPFLGDIFSQMSVWIFLGTAIALNSATAGRAALLVFLLCAGMLPAYYGTAATMGISVKPVFVYGWGIFAALTPVMAWLVWRAKRGDGWGKAIAAGVVMAIPVLAALLFDKVRLHDGIFTLLTAALFWKALKGKRAG